ncbi:hypothetical protein COOONC_25287 [Cooperia oncophora]
MFCEEQFGKGVRKKLPLGFTFSFPCKQEGTNKSQTYPLDQGIQRQRLRRSRCCATAAKSMQKTWSASFFESLCEDSTPTMKSTL